METPISITTLNDFIFCPASIYFHMIDAETEKMSYQSHFQLNGTHAHEKSDNREYSSRRDVLQGVSIYSGEYNLIGKIDTFDIASGVLTERKRLIKNIYDGYVFQIYAQYYCLVEMGYKVNKMRLYSMIDNKSYHIEKPEDNEQMLLKFKNTIKQISEFSLAGFKQDNIEKCNKCIYEPLCSFSAIKK